MGSVRQAGAGGGETDGLQDHWREAIRQLDRMIRNQEGKVLALGRSLHPGLTPEDARNPQDLEAVSRSPEFNYEDGILAGLLSVRALFLRVVAERRAEGPGTDRRGD